MSSPDGHDDRDDVTRSDSRKWWVLVAMVFGLFMPMLDNLVVNVALPTIQRELGAGVSELQWIIDAYTLTFASFMLTGGALGDLYGRKRFFMGGLVVFTIGSLLCALSGSVDQLIAFRALQGLGGALLLPGSLSIITATFEGRERGTAIGIWAAVSGLAIAVGPLVGGLLVEHFSWHSIFYVNVPVGLLGLVMTWFIVRESRDEDSSRKLDPPGVVVGTLGLFVLVYGLIEGNARGWSDPLIIGSFVAAAVLLSAFIVIEARRESPMLPVRFFKIRTFAAANVVAATVYFALFGVVFFLTLYLQNVQGYSPVGAGVRLSAFSAVIMFVAPVAGRLSDRFGSRWFMAGGPLIAAVGMGLMLRTDTGSSYLSVLLPSFLVLATGMALTMTPMTAAVMASVDERHAGVASAATNTSRELGGVFGVALLGAIVTSSFQHGLTARLLDAGVPQSQVSQISGQLGAGAASGSAAAAQGNEQVVAAVHESFVHAIHLAMLVALGLLLVASVVSAVFIRDRSRTQDADRDADRDAEPAARDGTADAAATPRADGRDQSRDGSGNGKRGRHAPAPRLAKHRPRA
jgi:EmrB/QacA subfamily drug resistance transporter